MENTRKHTRTVHTLTHTQSVYTHKHTHTHLPAWHTLTQTQNTQANTHRPNQSSAALFSRTFTAAPRENPTKHPREI